MNDLNTMFLYVFIVLMATLGVSNMIESRKKEDYTGQGFFALLFLVATVALILYKLKSD